MLNGVDALLAIVQMPKGVPVGTLAIGEPGAVNAALLAASIVAGRHPEARGRLRAWRAARTAEGMSDTHIAPDTRGRRRRPYCRPPRSVSSAAASWGAWQRSPRRQRVIASRVPIPLR